MHSEIKTSRSRGDDTFVRHQAHGRGPGYSAEAPESGSYLPFALDVAALVFLLIGLSSGYRAYAMAMGGVVVPEELELGTFKIAAEHVIHIVLIGLYALICLSSLLFAPALRDASPSAIRSGRIMCGLGIIAFFVGLFSSLSSGPAQLTFLLYVVTIGSFWVQPIRQIFDQDRAPLRRGKS